MAIVEKSPTLNDLLGSIFSAATVSGQKVIESPSPSVTRLTDKQKDLFRAHTPKPTKPPDPNETTGISSKIRKLTQLGINNILVPLTKAIFNRNADMLLQTGALTAEAANKIESAKFIGTTYLSQGALSSVTQSVSEKIIEISKKYKLRPNALPLALAIVKLVEKNGKV